LEYTANCPVVTEGFEVEGVVKPALHTDAASVSKDPLEAYMEDFSYKTVQVWRAVRGLRSSTESWTGVAIDKCVWRKVMSRRLRSFIESIVNNLK
jgi:hypothetical protein